MVDRFLSIGIIGELAHIATLVGLNVIGPRYLGLASYGDYSRAVGAAVLLTGLINTPLSLRLLVSSSDNLNRVPLRNMVFCAVGTALVAPLVGGLGLTASLAAVVVAMGQSLASATAHLGYRKSNSAVYAAAASWVALSTLGSIAYASFSGLSGTAAAGLQGLTILSGALLGLAATRRLRSPSARPAHTDRGALILSVPTVLAGVSQWLLVLLIGRLAGSEEAAVARIGTSVMGIPAAILPLSGPLLYGSAAFRPDARTFSAKVTLWGVIAGAVASSPILLFRADILQFIGGGRLDELAPLFPYLLVAGIGLMAVKLAWVAVASMFLSRRSAAFATALLLAAAGLAPFASVFGWRMGLGALGITYLLGLAVVVYAMVPRTYPPPPYLSPKDRATDDSN